MKTEKVLSQNVSRETFSVLGGYVELLLKWNQRINLIGPMTESDVWSRHIEDSLQLLPLLPSSAKTLVDLGSGAGLPGLVLAIARRDFAVSLIENDQRKSAFLNEVKSRLHLDNVTVITDDIARHAGQYDVVTARALASLEQLCALAAPLMYAGAAALFPKGERHAEELAQARTRWQFESALFPSATHAGAMIVSLSKPTPLTL